MIGRELSDAEAQQRLLKRLRVEARRWLLRGVLLLVMAVVSFARGGSFYVTLALLFATLAAMTYLMARQTRRSALELEGKMRGAEGKP